MFFTMRMKRITNNGMRAFDVNHWWKLKRLIGWKRGGLPMLRKQRQYKRKLKFKIRFK